MTALVKPARLGSYRDVVIRDKPTFFYDFSDLSFTTGTIKDWSDNGNDGTNLVQSTTPLLAVGQIASKRSALFPFVLTNQVRIQTPASLTYPELSVECTVSSGWYGYPATIPGQVGQNVRFLSDGHTDQGGYSRAGFEFYLPNSNNNTGQEAQQLSLIIGNGYAPWAASTAYVVGQRINHSGNVYQCTTAGTSSSSSSAGPNGTGTGIVDGTVIWDYVTVDQLSATTGNILLSGEAYHLVGTASVSGTTTTVSVYVNGKLEAAASADNFGTITSPFNVGVGFDPVYGGDFFSGWMGSAAAYDYGLTQEQVRAHYNAWRTGFVQ